MKNRFKLMSLLMGLGLIVTFSSCEDDDDPVVKEENGEASSLIITENVTANTTWTSDSVYVLGGRIAVEDGATLTIEPGTVIKGEAGTGASATALVVARGGQIMAEGTAEKPIIFTTVGDNIMPSDIEAGNIASPNMQPDVAGLWGGVIILGNAPISASNDAGDVTEINIEGIPSSDPNGLYGGNEAADNSGVFKYVSIRHGGSDIGEGNEINGLTLGGVGSGTTIENIEIVSNQDDGIEWFGGTVNVKNAVVWNVNDDGLDADQAWAGTVDNFMVITVAGHSFELDGPEGSMTNAGYTIKNGIVIANNDSRSSEDLINTDDNTSVAFDNIFFTGINENQINRVTHDIGTVSFQNIVLNVAEADLINHVNGEVVPDGVTAGTEPKSGVNVSAFDGWSWAAAAGATNYTGEGYEKEAVNVTVTENITENTTWSKNNVYILGGRIAVEAGATLTIEPGTVIKGESGTGASSKALVVARGAEIMAEGTEEAPIIFTSVGDDIMPSDIAAGNFASPNLEPDVSGLWGGVIILGSAPISASNDAGDVTEINIEGIPSSDPNGMYGGNDTEDNSGIFKYVSIRHGGSDIGEGNEINGLTLGGVGSGTAIENIEIVSNQDDGIEWFGGTVNVKNVVVWNVNDDGLDADQAWAGTVDNFMIVTVAGHSFELDGPEGSMTNAGYTIKNGVVIANNDSRTSEDLINTDDNTSVAFDNIFITGIGSNKINRTTHDVGTVSFSNIVLDVDAASLADHINDSDNVPAGITAGTAPATDIDSSVFGWTWANAADVLNY